MFLNHNDIERALEAVGQLLEAEDFDYAIVIIGGAALNLLGIVARTTQDVDILAVSPKAGTGALERPPSPLPDPLARAISQVARDFGLPATWLNAEPAGQWDLGLPDSLASRVRWREFGSLAVGIADRLDLIFFKLEASADQPTADSRHFRDLIALQPSVGELDAASKWAREKNVGPEFHDILKKVISHVSIALGRSG